MVRAPVLIVVEDLEAGGLKAVNGIALAIGDHDVGEDDAGSDV